MTAIKKLTTSMRAIHALALYEYCAGSETSLTRERLAVIINCEIARKNSLNEYFTILC